MVQYPWKRAAALAALVLVTTYVGLTIEPTVGVVPSPTATENGRGKALESVVDTGSSQHLRSSLLSHGNVFQNTESRQLDAAKLDTTLRIVGGSVAPV